jgi:uncharacterized protein (TIGR00369 family)
VKISPELLKNVVEKMVPFNRHLGIECTGLGAGYCRLELEFRPELIGDPLRKAIHGGVLSTLIDAAGGAAVWTMVEPADAVSTVDFRVDFLIPGKQERVVVEAHVVRVGNRVGVVDMRAFHPSASDRTIATGKGVYNIKRGKHPELTPLAEGQSP